MYKIYKPSDLESMPMIMEKIKSLESLDVKETKKDDFDEFWKMTLDKVENSPLNVQSEIIDIMIDDIEVRDITYESLDGSKIPAWFLLPKKAKSEKVPCVVFYHGYTGGRGTPYKALHWLMLGVAVIAPEFRMQSGIGESKTGFAGGSGTQHTYTMGILSEKTYYMYHMITDALLALKLAKEAEEIDEKRIAIEGGSQGGGVVLTVASLSKDVKASMADVPSCSWTEKRIMDKSGSFSAVSEFIKRHPEEAADVMKTLTYYDNINHVSNISAPILVSLGLNDPVCTPDTVYASLNKIRVEKEIIPFPFAGHEGGGEALLVSKIRFLKKHFGL